MIYNKTGIKYCTFGELQKLIKQSPEKGFSQLFICSTKISSKFDF